MDSTRADAAALTLAGLSKLQRADPAAAARMLDEALRLDPHRVQAMSGLGLALRDLGELSRAQAIFERALASAPATERPAHLRNCAIVSRERGRPEEAAAYLVQALSLEPDNVELLVDLALVRTDQQQTRSARELVGRALALDPDNARAHLRLAFDLLADGDFARGWQEYEWRQRIAGWEGQKTSAIPTWTPDAPAHALIFVTWEQGLGDQIMFASCVPDLIARGARLIIECDARLAALFRRSFPCAQIVSAAPIGSTPACVEQLAPTYQIPIGSLPLVFRRNRSDFPASKAYLVADPARSRRWSERLSMLGARPKIGISWRGGTASTRTYLRSFELEVVARICDRLDADVISLQYGDCDTEVEAFNRQGRHRVHHWREALEDYDDTAALICALDLVVTACTSLVHLCGALGRPCFVLVPAVAEWRYLREGSRMPWYESVRLHRQSALGDWGAPVEAVRAAVTETLRQQPSHEAPGTRP